jgi:hypothetical protein
MARYCVDCRDYPSETNCDLLMCGSEEHLIEAAVVHAVTAHKEKDTPELRETLRKSFKPDVTTRVA